ncbi:type II CAAX endopeptidase family protein [Amycolatopsis sp. PS_44_ISF1]|uniref:CPBP family intramembrane glutamic endopeptidase n=1 Tax=Amycolatopsis sp. PS_44_ISF1 TaxID=2974917 RepID=UPI0028DEE107|nr:type II CAAX endopeptidase family protein [Amycolatopsis sp. PS_44_ISF1]MDT8912329.1 CPBP family intramembrane metalloprotease [Amycolatopsis sp. PS_44_ISF1]
MNTSNDVSREPDHRRPGWPELGAAILTALILYATGAVIAARLPAGFPLSPGQANFLVSGIAPLGAFAVAVLVRIRDVRAFGMRRVHPGWLLVALAAGLVCFGLSWPVSAVFDPLFPHSEGVQQSYRDAADAGVLSLVVTVVLGGLLTPLGEEALFRGVLAGFLFRWGPWIGVPLSAAVFALAHGLNAVMPLAFVVGLSTGLLLRFSGSLWPAVVVHVVYNSAGILYHGVTGG